MHAAMPDSLASPQTNTTTTTTTISLLISSTWNKPDHDTCVPQIKMDYISHEQIVVHVNKKSVKMTASLHAYQCVIGWSAT